MLDQWGEVVGMITSCDGETPQYSRVDLGYGPYDWEGGVAPFGAGELTNDVAASELPRSARVRST